MLVIFTKQFDKQTAVNLPAHVKTAVLNVILNVESANKISDIKNLSKLKASAIAYRIRIGDYRIGMYISKRTATFVILAHRKDIYKFFP